MTVIHDVTSRTQQTTANATGFGLYTVRQVTRGKAKSLACGGIDPGREAKTHFVSATEGMASE